MEKKGVADMKLYLKKAGAAVLAGVLCIGLFGGCASSGKPSQDDSENTSESVPDTFKPSEFAIASQDQYEEPYMGLRFTLPKSLTERMDSREVAMLSEAQDSEDGSSVVYYFFSWNMMTKEQLEAEVPNKGNGFYEWGDSLERIGTLGVYHIDQAGNLDKLTKCKEHKEIGKSEDGTYVYYLSTNPDADQALAESVSQIEAEITEMTPLTEENQAAEGGSLGAFSIQDIAGEAYTEEMFQDYELTMVNVFTTWCTPCINEIPDLQKLYEEMKGQGVQIVGVVLDAMDSDGSQNEEAVQKAKLLAERTGAAYPFLIPDGNCFNGRLDGIEAVPETFFVDKNGSIVGKTYSGSHSLEDWRTIVQEQQDSLKGENP